MITVNYSKILGHCLLINKHNQEIDVTIYGGNCLAVLTNKVKEDNGDITELLVNFYADEQHIKRIAENYTLTDHYTDIKLNFAHKEARILAKHWVKEKNIEIYYKE